MYDLLFELEDNLSKRYTSLNPLVLRREKCGEVLLLIRRINRLNQAKTGLKKDDTIYYDSKGNKHIRRKAMNDDWY
jgi:hypothetical protein